MAEGQLHRHITISGKLAHGGVDDDEAHPAARAAGAQSSPAVRCEHDPRALVRVMGLGVGPDVDGAGARVLVAERGERERDGTVVERLPDLVIIEDAVVIEIDTVIGDHSAIAAVSTGGLR